MKITSILNENGNDTVVAITKSEELRSAGNTVAPPTHDKGKICINEVQGEKQCTIDTIQSQANRIEPIFKEEKYAGLVPTVIIEGYNGRQYNLLDMPHRAGDASFIMSKKGHEYFMEAWKEVLRGDFLAMANLAPTSLVFGAWESRITQGKLSRIIDSEIIAHNVSVITRKANLLPEFTGNEENVGEDIAKKLKEKVGSKTLKSVVGLEYIPDRERTVIEAQKYERCINLRIGLIRKMCVLNQYNNINKNQTNLLQKYILGLVMVVATAPLEGTLRSGCTLAPKDREEEPWTLLLRRGDEKFTISHDECISFARTAAKEFKVSGEELLFKFDEDHAKKILDDIKNKKKK